MQHTKGPYFPMQATICSLMLIGFAALGLLVGCSAIKVGEVGTAPKQPYAPLSAANHISIMTINAWRLRENHRVPRLLKAAAIAGKDIALQKPIEKLPDVLLLQELENEEPTKRLQARLQKTHWFQHCICAKKGGKETRSAVGIAVDKARYQVVSHQCLSLGCLWPDHARCAIHARMKSRQTNAEIDVISVHLSSRPGNAGQAKKLVEVLREKKLLERKRLIIGGDFNFHERSGGYRHLTTVLQDFHPTPSKRGRTHWYGGRIDFLFVSKEVKLVRALNRRVAFDAFRVASRSGLSGKCRDNDLPTCPLTDHLPEGGVFSLTTR